MTDIASDEHRRAFAWWLRTGRLPVMRSTDGVEVKFNPYHDPLNGRFTFAPGGRARAAERRARSAEASSAALSRPTRPSQPDEALLQNALASGTSVSAPLTNTVDAHLAQASRPPIFGRGGNARAAEDAMTLEQTFPGLAQSPGGAIIVAANNLLDLWGPADAAQIEIIDRYASAVFAQIKAVDPKWHFDELGPNTSVQGRFNRLDTLRWQRATVFLRVRGDAGPLQVETLRFVQQQTDAAYQKGLVLLKAGRLTPRLSEREALGNYVDSEVRRNLRLRYNRIGIESSGKGPVRVNRRENDTSGTDLTYRRPDARVADVAFDVTLTQKTLKTPQVRGFFNTDFQPSRVVIIRPRQLGPGATYVISRPETKR